MLSTKYRRPIEYSDEEIDSKRKGLDTFYRLFERVERLCGTSPYGLGNEAARQQGNKAKSEPGAQATGGLLAASDKAYAAFVKSELERWTKVIKTAGIKAE